MVFGVAIWLFFVSGFCCNGKICAKQWFVSRLHGISAHDCGLEASHPCKTINQAMSRANNGDVINIDGEGTSRDPYPCEAGPIGAGLVMRNYKTRVFIACASNSFRWSCNFMMKASVVTLKGITFVNTSLLVDECSLKMADCSFISGFNVAVSLHFARNSAGNVDLDGCNFQNNSAGSLKISGNAVNLTCSNSSFANNKLRDVSNTILAISTQNVPPQQISIITVYFKNITVSLNSCPGHACFNIVAGLNGKLALEMDQVNFEDNKSGESILDVQNSSQVSVKFKSTQFKKNVGRAVKFHDGDALELKIIKGMFAENKLRGNNSNGGAVFVSRFTQKAFVSMSRSHFSSNKAGNGGACAFADILYLMLDIESCEFVQNEAWVAGGAVAVGSYHPLKREYNASLDIRSSHFYENIVDPDLNSEGEAHYNSNMHNFKSGIGPAGLEGGGALSLFVSTVQRLSLENTTFFGNMAKRRNSGAIQAPLGALHTAAVVRNCEFIKNSGDEATGTLRLTVSRPSSTFRPQIILQNSTFIENKGSSFYDIYLFSSHVQISSCKIQGNSGGGINLGIAPLNILLENSLISDNSNFVFNLYRDTSSWYGSTYQFNNVSFINNTCTVRSSIFRASLYVNQTSLLFEASAFKNNFCESGVVKISVWSSSCDISIINDTSVTINNTEFRRNSGVSESALTIVGVKMINILNSNFTNNFGSTDGSHFRLQMRSSELTICKTNFYQSKKSQVFHASREQPYNGFLTVTSLGKIKIRESSFVLDPFSADGVNLIFVKGASNVVMNDSVIIQTPFSTKLHLHNFTHWEQTWHSNQAITSFSLVTEPCPVGTYSINRDSSEGFNITNNVQCLPCPAGGNCTSSLSARQNFWGYPIGDKVHFKLCPQGYCCPTANKSCAYNNRAYLHSGCQGNRTGILCGNCKNDFSETLFTSDCLPSKDCTHLWYFIIIFLCTSLFAMFLIRKPPVFEKVMKNLTWFLPRYRKKNHKGYDSLESDTKSNSGSSSGLLKILFYFYQIAGVLTASYYGVSAVLKNNILLPVISLLDFKITVNNDWNICPYPGITPLAKILSQLAAVTATFLSISVFYLLHSGLNKLRKRTPALPPCGPYLAATLEVLLLGYSAATGTAMKLLDCVQIQHVSRWFYDAEITCPQWWQEASLTAIVVYLVPFIFTLYFASLQLYQGQISAKIFFLACVFPLLYLLLAFIVYVNKVISKSRAGQETKCKSSIADREESDETSSSTVELSVLGVLTAPFRKPRNGQSGKIHWESVLIGRRFVLILLGSVLKHAFLRSVCLTILCLAFLLHHISRKPFVHFRDNLAETVSLATLVVIAVLNVGVTSFYSMGVESSGVESQYVRGFLLAEAVLLGLVPFLFAVFVSLSLVSQLVRLMIILTKAAWRLIFKTESCERIRLS